MEMNIDEPKVTEKYPLWLRIVHWINFPILFLMVWSGILIYWANRVYPGFFPDWFYRVFNIDHRLAEGMAVHFTIAWVFVINGLLYFAYLIFSGHWRKIVPTKQTFKYLIPTLLHEFGLRKTAPPQGQFNSAQMLAYFGVWFLGIIEVLTGFSIYKPVQLSWLTWVFGGYETARAIHFSVMVLFVLFFLVHVIQVARAGWNNFRAMVAGFEVQDDKQ
jgi:thiosulfate reductase cytochrome b subunit